MFWSWCFAHHLELASKSGLTSQLFKVNGRNDAALVLLVQETPKKTQELMVIVEDLKEIFQFPDSDNIPIHSEGSRWITHKTSTSESVGQVWGIH